MSIDDKSRRLMAGKIYGAARRGNLSITFYALGVIYLCFFRSSIIIWSWPQSKSLKKDKFLNCYKPKVNKVRLLGSTSLSKMNLNRHQLFFQQQLLVHMMDISAIAWPWEHQVSQNSWDCSNKPISNHFTCSFNLIMHHGLSKCSIKLTDSTTSIKRYSSKHRITQI